MRFPSGGGWRLQACVRLSSKACASRAALWLARFCSINMASKPWPKHHTSSKPLFKAAYSNRSKAFSVTMADKCGNCDCADKSQCVKKGNSYGVVIVDAEKSYFEVAEVAAAEHDGSCKCGTSCSCTDCTCGN